MQFNDARLIPASRAVPGDLVFYHDNVGACTTSASTSGRTTPSRRSTRHEGVNYQSIWDPGSATYGSFTHYLTPDVRPGWRIHPGWT